MYAVMLEAKYDTAQVWLRNGKVCEYGGPEWIGNQAGGKKLVKMDRVVNGQAVLWVEMPLPEWTGTLIVGRKV